MPIALSLSGETFEISPTLWQQNQHQQQLLKRYFALPLASNEQTLWLGVDNLENVEAHQVFGFLTGKRIEPVVLATHHLKQLLQSLSPKDPLHSDHTQLNEEAATYDWQTQEDNEPIVLLVNHFFEEALQKNASDIHLEPQATGFKVRFRIDGVLHRQQTLNLSMGLRMVSRLKLLAKLDISESRLPQDGRFHFTTAFNESLEFRLSTLPTQFGEKAVLRVQKNTPVSTDFYALGFEPHQVETLVHALKQPQGLILVTGPTGSGKSITLYSALSWLNSSQKHILTAEDPIEIHLPGIVQSQINPQIGLTFERLLRTFLRQDPDIIMLGEIRDEESAKMALRAAQTGHLVLSTLHTNDAKSALSRLQQLGIHSYEIEKSLLLVIAQRLLRKICSACNGKGCKACQGGYLGRIGIYQLLQLEESTNQQLQFHQDYPSLLASSKEKLKQTITDEKEIERVLGVKVSR